MKMPVPSGFQNCISDSLKKSLSEPKKNGGQKQVGQAVASSAKRSLLEKAEIKFVKAENDVNSMLQNLKNKYICLNRSHGALTNGSVSQNGQGDSHRKGSKNDLRDDGIPKPKVVLYAADKLKPTWESPRRVGAGLSNLGNTCFLNSVLQCLSYTPALANHFLGGQHKSLLISKHMRWGRQEDAHEFLRYVVDAMQKSCLAGQSNSLEKLSKETTFMHQVFGGYLRSQVRCLQCKTTSNTYDPVLDISVDLKGVNSVEKALQKFVQPEMLDIDNAYKCARCKKKVRAVKQFTIHRAPKVLTVHLKRFDYHRLMGGKVSRHIEFSHKLNLRSVMSQRQGDPVNYQLYGVLVHSGYSCNSGHYYCYINAPNQTWYCMNDSSVSQTGLNNVLGSEAYILFYNMVSPTSAAPPKAATHVNSSQTLSNGSTPIGKDLKTQMPSKGPVLLKTPQSLLQKLSTTAGATKQQVQSNERANVAPSVSGQPRRVSLTTLNNLISEDSPRQIPGKSVTMLAAHETHTLKGGPQTSNVKAELNGNGPVKLIEMKKHKLVNDEKENGASSPKKSGMNGLSIEVDAACQSGSAVAKQVSPRKMMSPLKLMSPKNLLSAKILMSPPRSKSEILGESCRATTPNWHVTPMNGRTRYPSESESCSSLSSTSEWKVIAYPKSSSNVDVAVGFAEKKNRKKELHNSALRAMESGSSAVKRKKEVSPVEGVAGKIPKLNLNNSATKTNDSNCRRNSCDMKQLNESTRLPGDNITANEIGKPQKQGDSSNDESLADTSTHTKHPTDVARSAHLNSTGSVKKKRKRRKKKRLTVTESGDNTVLDKETPLKSVNSNGFAVDKGPSSSENELLNNQVNGNKLVVAQQNGAENGSIKKKKKKKKKKKNIDEGSNGGGINTEIKNTKNTEQAGHNGKNNINLESTKKRNKLKHLNQGSHETEIHNTNGHEESLNCRAEDSSLVDASGSPTGKSINCVARKLNGPAAVELNGTVNGLVKKKKKRSGVLNQSVVEQTETGDTDAVSSKDQLAVAKEKMKKKRRYSEPAVKDWDANVEDDDSAAFRREAPRAPTSAWDGRKDSNISFLMERHAAIKGLGSGVLTWGGQKPEINREVEREKLTANYKDGWYDGYEQQIDEGRTKKVKLKKNKHRGNQNHFQSIQNNTNAVTQLRKEGKLPSLPDY